MRVFILITYLNDSILETWGFPCSSVRVCLQCRRPGLDPWVGKISPGEGNGNLLQYSCLESSVDRGAWQAIAHGVSRVGCD